MRMIYLILILYLLTPPWLPCQHYEEYDWGYAVYEYEINAYLCCEDAAVRNGIVYKVWNCGGVPCYSERVPFNAELIQKMKCK